MAPYNNAPEAGTRDGRPTAGRGSGAGAPVGGALFVGLIGLCALVISYNGIFPLAEYGGHEDALLAHAFPVAYTLLLVMACWVSYLLRDAHPRERFWVDLVLIPLLVLFATVAMLLHNLQLIERVHQGVANVVVAVMPLAGLLVAFLLWMVLRAHTRRRRRRGPVARPRPADDPTTVLHARAAAPPAEAPAPAAPRREGDDAAERGWDWERDRWDDGTATTEPLPRLPRVDVPEPGAGPEDTSEDEEEVSGAGAAPEAVPETVPGPEAGGDGEPEDDWAGENGEDGTESSVPVAPLPRRGQAGHNPIRRAAEQVPVVPGAAAPTDAEPEPEPVVVVPDHLADEGFEHEPPPGDPVSDEADADADADASPAEAPLVADTPDPRSGPEPAPAPGRTPGPDAGGEPEPEPEPRPGLVPEHVSAAEAGEPQAQEDPAEPEPVPSARTPDEPEADHGLPPEAPEGAEETGADGSGEAEEPGTALWEPPEDDSGTAARALADYVPPVWTPPEDPSPPAEEYREPEATPVLDHDTGPDVRAAFRIGDVPPGAASPADESAGPAPEPRETARAAQAEEEHGPVPGSEPLTEAEEPPSAGADGDGRGPGPGPGEGSQRAWRGQRSPLEKRPMVLKPRRPPVTDFVSGPPSRRVRSEPLRPDE
ncbi:hypothetical protein HNR06_001847 [Nocardiopsis arvandica]|uniref:DUF2637 domain-containing protein n=1 Tax=Nocardiopsis sinuspersici TaxID=501010 RepID=A0A7Y9XCZ0_9ACTN|nr:DUF2637 domain-containing protein [Nocardiopsis sinuspersici]NYH52258.1 hypothetical protein [Nocardiopsis sinuspersici]